MRLKNKDKTMMGFLLYLFFISSVLGMEFINPENPTSSDTFIYVSDSDSTEEERPLLNEEIPQDVSQILANSILVPLDLSPRAIARGDLLTPFSNRHPSGLPKDIFWFIISLCEEKDILNLCETSTHIRNQLRKLIPILPPLSSRPSSMQILNFLEKIECWKERHEQLSKSRSNVINILNAFPRYWEELDRLNLAQTYVRFSPHFWWHNGSKRVQQIREYYGIDAPKGDYSRLPLHIISSILRDPYGIHLCCTGLALLTGVTGWYIYMNHQNYADEVALTNATYIQTFQNNLKYAQSDAFYNTLKPDQGAGCTDTSGGYVPKICFNSIRNDLCMDRAQICQSNDIVKELEDLGLNIDQFLTQNPPLKAPQFHNFLIESMKAFCRDNYYFLFQQKSNNMTILTSLRNPCNDNCWLKHWNTDKTDFLMIRKDTYDPHCIAEHLTTPFQLPPFPIATDLLWLFGLAGSYLTFIIFLILGWCMGV